MRQGGIAHAREGQKCVREALRTRVKVKNALGKALRACVKVKIAPGKPLRTRAKPENAQGKRNALAGAAFLFPPSCAILTDIRRTQCQPQP